MGLRALLVHVRTYSKLELVERMFIDVIELLAHFNGEIHEITKMSVFIALRFQRIDPGSGHVGASNGLDLLDAAKLLVI